MEAGRYAAPIHGYGYTVLVRWGTVSFGVVRFGEARRSGYDKFWRGELWSGEAWRGGRGEVSQVAVSSVEDWLVTAVQVGLGSVSSGALRSGGAGRFRYVGFW